MLRLLLSSLLILLLCDATAQRIVSLMPSATYIAAQIGADANVVGRTAYCPAPSSGVTSRVVGDVMTVNVEAIVALRPDVVIASNFTQQSVINRLKALKIKLVTLSTPKSFDEICSQTVEIGQLTNHLQQAQSVCHEQSNAIDSIAANVSWSRGKSAYVQVGARPLWGATPDYYINELLSRLAMRNVLNLGEGGTSREEVTLRHPDVVIISSLGGLASEEQAAWQKATKAKTVIVNENELSCPTPLFFRLALEKVCNALNN